MTGLSHVNCIIKYVTVLFLIHTPLQSSLPNALKIILYFVNQCLVITVVITASKVERTLTEHQHDTAVLSTSH